MSTWIGLTYIGTGKEIADMMTKSRIALAEKWIALALRSVRVVERGKVAKMTMKVSTSYKLKKKSFYGNYLTKYSI